MRRYALVLLLLAAPLRADGPEPPKAAPPVLTLPAEKQTPVGKPVTVVPLKNDGAEIRWLLPDAGLTEERGFLDLIPEEFKAKLTGRMFYSDTKGRYRVWAVSARGGLVSDKAECWIVVGDAPPPVPPVPPGPGPGPAPIPGDGLRVLIVYESAELSKLPKEQLSVLYGGEVRGYLNSHCVKADGKAEWRIWDQNAPTGAESATWQAAMQVKRDKLPWLIVSTGKTGFSGPLPGNVTDTMKLLTTYGGN